MKRVALHILFWSVIIIWRANGDYVGKVQLEKFIWHNVIRLPFMMGATYFLIYFILPKHLIEEKNYLKFSGLFVLNFLVATYLDRMITNSDWMFAILGLTTEYDFKVFRQIHPFRNTFMLLSIMGLASLIRFFKLYIDKEKKEHELKEEHLSTKLAFLKSQVNPHFLFNALNNIYSLAIQKEQPEIASGIENLSGIMHYLTYESNADQVPLEKEIELIRNYIDIQYLRFADEDDITISFLVEGSTKNKMIAPVILLPLVENTFKHGIEPDRQSVVSIKIIVENNNLFFKTINTYYEKSGRGVSEEGIGIENVTKRLQLIYPNDYIFKTEIQDSCFLATLELQLNSK